MSAEFDQCISEWADRVAERDKEIAQLQARLTASERERDDYRQRQDAAYNERNKVVAALAKLFPSGIARTNIEGWDAEWHGCVYIDLPWGQVSWHYHDSQAELFMNIPPYTKPWDGHDTDEKYHRLKMLTPSPARRWTREKPTVPGHYWWRDKAFALSGGEKIVKVDHKDLMVDWGETCEWSGPIPVPEEEA